MSYLGRPYRMSWYVRCLRYMLHRVYSTPNHTLAALIEVLKPVV